MRVLVLASYIPSRFKGAEIRLLHMLRHLSRRHEMTLWAINRRDIPVDQVAAELSDCRLLLPKPGDTFGPLRGRLNKQRWFRKAREWRGAWLSRLPLAANQIYFPALKQALADLIRRESFDLIVVTQIMIGVYLPDKLEIPVLLSKDNVWADLRRQEYEAAQGGVARLKAYNEWRKMLRYESRMVRRAQKSVVVSDPDGVRIRELVPTADVRVVPNGVDTGYFRSTGPAAGDTGLVFVGTMSWQPNEDAMVYFAEEIFPRILARRPETTLTIVGVKPPKSIRRLGRRPNIRVTGEVPDVRPYIEEAAMFVVPLRAGSGTRLKILEALSMEKSVVSTTLGAEGLEVVSGEHLFLADDPASFADAVCALLADPERRRQLGRSGRTLVETRYDWAILADRMDAVMTETAGAAR